MIPTVSHGQAERKGAMTITVDLPHQEPELPTQDKAAFHTPTEHAVGCSSSSVETLSLKHTAMGPKASVTLAATLRLTTVTSLNISTNPIRDEAMVDLLVCRNDCAEEGP